MPSKKPRTRRPPSGGTASAGGSTRAPTLIVGIGASAGGLDALEKLFSAMPADTGIAFVVVQHLDPRHPSLLAELLARSSRIAVSQAEDGARPQADHVYVIAPRTVLTVEDGALRVAPSGEETSIGRIDAFLSSLAKDGRECTVGVILSGAGSDGIVGLRMVKDQGGLVLAQDPATASHGSMPRTAIEAGLVDQVLAIDQIPSALVAHARHLVATGSRCAVLETDLAGSIRAICALLHQRTGHDFSRYKEGTLLRRIRRRVHVQRAASAADYLRVLEHDPAEPERLLKDLLIGVTQFFRDPETFAVLAREVLPRTAEGKPPDAPIRIWVPGCASGEEAYSIAILVHERLAREEARRFVQIFATDLDAEMIAEAREGRYPAEIADQVSPERLERYFVREGSGYRVGIELREMCIFSVHSLIRDPPFSALDLVSCRNVLIYLEPDLQKKVIPLFHYALRPGGCLLLGPAEAITNQAELFETVDKKHRIYRRKETVARPPVEFPLSARAVRKLGAPATGAAAAMPRPNANAAIERMLLDDYAPPCAVVNGRGDIEFVAGRIGRFLAPPAGAPTPNLLDAVRDSLRRELRAALHAAVTGGGRVVRDAVPVELEEGVHRVRLTVRPVPGAPGLFAVVIQERAPEDVEPLEVMRGATAPPALEEIENELRTTRADLKTAVENAEAANEELRSANEELISTNEELQSANEEMQTSKEELQSLNEELETVNAELQRKVDELGVANSDLQNLFASTEIATIFLDRDLRIARFTPAATALLHLIEGDIGRPIGDFAPRFDGQDLVSDAREVLRSLQPIARPIRIDPERWFILRVLPYRTVENVIAGIVVTFVDVSELKRAEEKVRESEERYRLLIEGVRDYAAFMLAPDGTVATWNAGAERLKGYRSDEIVGQHISRFYAVEDVRAGKPQHLIEVAAAQGHAADEGWRVRKDGSRFWASVLLTAIRDGAGSLRGFAKVIHDTTEFKRAEAALRASEDRYRLLFHNMLDGFAYCRLLLGDRGRPDDFMYVDVNDSFARLTGLRDVVGKKVTEVIPGIKDSNPELFATYGRVAATGRPEKFETYVGALGIWFSISVYSPEKQHFVAVFDNITERKRAEEALERSREGLSRLAQASLSVIRETDLHGMLQAISEAALALTGARLATCGHGYVGGRFLVGGSARAPGAPACPPGDMFLVEKGGVHMDLLDAAAIRLTDAQLRAHPRWWGLPEAHVPMRGMLGVRMVGRDGQTSGVILVTDKEHGEFSEEDESLLRQLGTIASLALQHVEARISLEEADRSKNHFLAMLSHELRNPLAPIRNSLTILHRAAPGGEQARRAQAVIERQVVHLTQLVDDLLDLTRISRGKIQLRREPLDLGEAVRRAAEDHRASFANNGLDLAVSVPERPLWISGDRTRVAQVIGNLLENSAKFTDRGGRARIDVEENATLRQAVVRVRDTGTGIAKEMQARIFEPFTQADTTLERSKGGLGLGLALVKGLIEMHGGTVSVESEGLGKGAEFTVRLPLDVAEVPAAASARAGPGAARLRILVIEDNVDAAESLRDVLELAEHTVEVAFSGADGIERARAFRPDVILCDIGLPGMDGYQVARTVRADPALREVKLVALTGYAAPDDVAKSREAGFDAHVSKPPSVAAIEEALSPRSAEMPPPGGTGERR